MSSNSASNERFIQSIFCLLGIGILLPWNAFVSAKPYFQARLCSNEISIGRNVELYFGLVYNLSSVVSLAFIISLQWWRDTKVSTREADTSNESPTSDSEEEEKGPWWMIMIPLGAYLVVFMLTTLLVLLPTVNPTFFLAFTFCGLFICGICTAFASAGVVGTAGLFSASLGINPYFSGQAVGGVAVACANFFAATLQDPQPFLDTHCSRRRRMADESSTCVPYNKIDWASFSYFLLGSLVLAACMVGYRYIDQYQRTTALRSSYESLSEASQRQPAIQDSVRGNIELHDQDVGESTSSKTPVEVEVWEPEPHEHGSSVSLVFTAVKAPAFAVFMTFFVTLSLFPGFTSQLKSAHECHGRTRLANDLYTPLTFVLFNAGDLSGRLLAARITLDRIQHVSKKLVCTSLARSIFFPLFLLCLAQESGIIPSDIYSVLVQTVFGMGNGLLTALCFMHAPTLVPAVASTQTRASEILNLALSFGLLCGSIFSFPFTRIATGHW